MTWTKFSEWLPEDGVPAVFVSWSDRSTTIVHRPVGMFSGSVCPIKWRDWLQSNTNAIAWHPITYPEVPKEEPQKTQDDAVFAGWDACTYKASERTFRNAWMSALRYERAEVAKEIVRYHENGITANEFITRLRRRVGLDK